MISGTATAVSGKVAANQAARAQQTVASPASTPQPAGAPPADTGSSDEAFSDDAYEQLKKLGEMREAGILADEEFQAKKAQILAL